MLGCRHASTSQSWWLSTPQTGLFNEFPSQNTSVVISLYGGLFWHYIQQSRVLEVSWHVEFSSAYLKLVLNQPSFAFRVCGINGRSRHRPLLSGRLTPIIWVINMLSVFRYMMNGFQQMIGGLLAYLFSLIGADKVIKSWQALFITYGCFSVLFGVFVLLFMPDSPMTAKCFSEEDKRLMIERVRDNRTGIQNKKFRKYQVIEALKDPQMWCYCGIQLFTTLPTSGLGTFANIIIKGFHFTTLQTQLLSMVLGAYIIFVLLSSMWLVKKTNQNLIVMAAYCIP